MENPQKINANEVLPSGNPVPNTKKVSDDPFGLARAAESFRHAVVDSTDIREREKTLRDANMHAQKMKELDHAESERQRTFKSNWAVAGVLPFPSINCYLRIQVKQCDLHVRNSVRRASTFRQVRSTLLGAVGIVYICPDAAPIDADTDRECCGLLYDRSPANYRDKLINGLQRVFTEP
jgi:hypothetical protein